MSPEYDPRSLLPVLNGLLEVLPEPRDLVPETSALEDVPAISEANRERGWDDG